MTIGANWADIWDEAIWNTAIWSHEAAAPEPEVRPITAHDSHRITIGTARREITAHQPWGIKTDA